MHFVLCFVSVFLFKFIMDKSFDFGALLKIHVKKHKSKPTQFVSVAGGVTKRLENISKHRKSSRLSSFDCNRNLPQLSRDDSPIAIPEAKTKVEHRRQQLEKWKLEKEKKKKEIAAQKKKPFLAGVPHNPLNFVPPPPLLKVMPSTSGRVTRSQTRSQMALNKQDITVPRQPQLQSFAPKNATFRAPRIENLNKLPVLSSVNTRDKKVTKYAFEPVMPKKVQTDAKQQTRMTRRTAKELRDSCKTAKVIPKARPTCVQSSSSSENESSSKMQIASSSNDDLTAPLISSSSKEDSNKIYSSSTENEFSPRSLQSSSSSEMEIEKKQSPVIDGKSRKSLVVAARPAPKSKTPQKCMTSHQSQVSNENDFREVCTSRNSVPKSESSSEEKLRSPKTPVEVPMTQEQNVNERKLSPCVTMSRGKDNARREMKKKLEEGALDEDASDMDDVDHFRRQLASEIKRITEMCETWDKIYEQVELPETVQEAVLAAVGQARLLMSQKMQQFAALVERCARPAAGAALVTPADLHGFWDMLFMQVVNVDVRFKELEALKARDWLEEVPAPVVCNTKPAAKQNVKPAAKPNVKPAAKPKATGGTSRLREMIAAARKAKQQDLQPLPACEDKTFEAGFFCVRSPVRSPSTPNKHNLLKAVLSSEAKKASASKNRASFAMLRASLHSKNVECDGVAPLLLTPTPHVNLYATPGRSILKQTQDNTIKKIGEKSVKMVLFDQSDTEIDENSSPTDNIIQQDVNKDSGKKDKAQKGKVHSRRSTRQNVVDDTPLSVPMTRNRRKSRKSKQTPQEAEQRPIRNSKYDFTEQAENVEEKHTLKHQNAETSENSTPVTTKRGRNKSMITSQEAEPRPLRSCRKKNVLEVKSNVVEETQTPKSSSNAVTSENSTPVTTKSRRNKSMLTPQEAEPRPLRSCRQKHVLEVKSNVVEETQTPKRSSSSRKTD